MTALECIQLKQQSRFIIALLKNGFVLVKTWLLTACGTGFYAIITVSVVVSLLAFLREIEKNINDV